MGDLLKKAEYLNTVEYYRIIKKNTDDIYKLIWNYF